MTPSVSDIARALAGIPADPFVEPPRGRGRRVGDDALLEHRVAVVAYARPGAELDAAVRAAFLDYPRPGPGQTRILDCLRLRGESVDYARRMWATRTETAA